MDVHDSESLTHKTRSSLSPAPFFSMKPVANRSSIPVDQKPLHPWDGRQEESDSFLFEEYMLMASLSSGRRSRRNWGLITRFRGWKSSCEPHMWQLRRIQQLGGRSFPTLYSLHDHMTSPIPSTLSFEQAAVIPFGASTASCELFQQDQLALQPLTVPLRISTGKTLLIWGGPASVGCNATQLAVAAGYEVITTCSPQNIELVEKLGGSQVFEYSSKIAVPDIIRASKATKHREPSPWAPEP